jgi:formate hydrogenlyase transcriptional activator
MTASTTHVLPMPKRTIPSDLISSQPGLRKVWNDVLAVARTDSTVLIQGETGTGKEVVARALHEESLRAHRPYIKLNCAALPAGLLESELFGHERGAFTGAVAQTDGRFLQAHTGTLFLDEIGDLPLELQPKLLRVLQDQEFERLGSGYTIKVDVRVVAATNQNLQQMVCDRRFRADLFYRLNVFPISIPPLRNRSRDIPLLVEHFAATLAAGMNKGVPDVSRSSLETLKHHNWPGNVRELKHFIERVLIRSSGSTFDLSAGELMPRKRLDEMPLPTLAQAERDHILRVLDQAGNVVGGRNGAASRLGLPRTTLLARMQRLGISAKRIAVRPDRSDAGVVA